MKNRIRTFLLLAGTFCSFASALAQPVITSQPTNQLVFGGSNVTFRVTVSGTGPFAYQWQFNGTNLPNDLITRVAGGGNGGDGGLATNASIPYPYCVAVDRVGNLYIGDSANNRVRKVDTNGIITTFAGNGTAAFAGDGGLASNACLSFPNFVASDVLGNVFITDYNNSRIRKVDTNGVITTVAGNGDSAYSGDGGAATNASLFYPTGLALDTNGNLFIADYNNARTVNTIDVKKILILERVTQG